MKRIIASAGLVALGITGVKAVPVATAPADKPWSISASLRGFYDDNYALAPNGATKDDSFGFEFNPKVGVTLNGQQTSGGATYSYTLRYFEGRSGNSEKLDHTHEFNAWLTHQFSERYQIDLRDTLVYSEEPTLTGAGTSVIRTEGTVFHNTAVMSFTAQLTRLFGIVTGYRNEVFDYQDHNYADILDRVEHYMNLDLTWTVSPQTVFLTGYTFGIGNYCHDRGFAKGNPADFYSHYVYAGITHNVSSQFSVALKAGARYTEYCNVPVGSTLDNNTVGPYVQGSMRYTYLPGSFFELGVMHDRTATDVNNALNGETTLLWATLSHSFTPKFIGTITGSAQFSDYDVQKFAPPRTSSAWDNLYTAGVNLEYRFTQNLSANVAYNHDTVCSDQLGRSYDRNRIFMGATVSY